MQNVPFRLHGQLVVSYGTVRTEDGDLDSEYVLDMDQSCDSSHWAVNLSDGTLKVYSARDGLLSASSQVIMSQKCTNVIQALKCSMTSPHTIYTAFSNGFVNIWDTRTPTPCLSFKTVVPDGEDLNSMDVALGDSLLATAAGAGIYFYDLRSGGNCILGEYSDCHSDFITKIKFNKTQPSVLTSGGEDGLLCTYDTATPASRSAVVSILNIECPIRNFFYFGHSSDGICCMSSVETLSCWHFPSAQRICNFPDIRITHSLDYLVDGWYDSQLDALHVLGGHNTGSGSIMTVTPSCVTTVSTLSSGHHAGIRCCKYVGKNSVGNEVLLTGGEDAKICCWTDASGGASVSSSCKPASSAAVKSKTRGYVALNNNTPY